MRPKLALGVVLGALLLAPAADARTDYGKRVYDVLPPGQSGSIPPNANSTDQLRLFDGLTPLMGNVRASDIPRYFKREVFGPRGRTTVEQTTRSSVRIVRDAFGVPHITARKRKDVLFGAGWATATDRAVLLETIRGPSKLAALDAPGIDAFALAANLRQFDPSSATIRRLGAQRDLVERTARGRQVVRDAQAYVAGINAKYEASGNTAPKWTLEDVTAIGSLIGAAFGVGGGDEIRNGMLLSALRNRLGADPGRKVFRDLTNLHEPDRTFSVPGSFPYNHVPGGPTPGSRAVDAGSLDAAARRSAAVAANARQSTSNALLVSPRRSATGNALASMGPQVGYFYPNLFLEVDLHGGGIDSRGIMLAGLQYPVIGRGKDYAWSITSGNSDNIDQFLEQLCNPDGSPPTRASDHYMYKGRCRAMRTFDAGFLHGDGGAIPDRRVVYHETVHGPVGGTVTVGGKPYATAKQRSTFGRDAVSVAPLQVLNDNDVHSGREFLRTMGGMEFVFNFLYVDERDIAMYHGGRFPVRAPGTDPSLPTLGTGRYEWRRFLRPSEHPQVVNPPSGAIANWNNVPARDWAAGDDDWSQGIVHRVDLLRGLKRRGNRLHDVVGVANRAATQDIKAVDVWPAIRRVLRAGSPPSALAQQAADLVSRWSDAGGSRLDSNLDGQVDHPGAAVLDTAWPHIGNVVLGPVLGPLVDQLASMEERDRGPFRVNETNSTYGVGWYAYVAKDLKTLLGDDVTDRYSRRYCGDGSLQACSASLWAVIQLVANRLSATQGPDPSGWFADATAERIRFRPGVLPNTMRWANRPTAFHQVMEFGGHRPR